MKRVKICLVKTCKSMCLSIPSTALTHDTRDYESNDALDRYSDADIDDRSSVPALSRAERLAAEAAMARRDRGLPGARAARRSRAPGFLQSDDDIEVAGPGAGLLDGVNTRRRRRQYDERPDEDDAEGEEVGPSVTITETDAVLQEISLEHLGDVKASSITEWVAIDQVKRAISRHFRNFLLSYVDENGHSVYGMRIKHLGEVNSESLEVSYLHLATSYPILAFFLANSPQPMLAIFDQVALDVIFYHYPNYDRIHSEIHVRIAELPSSTTLRDLRQTNLNSLVRVTGVVTRRSGVFPQLKYVKFDCGKCGQVLGPFFQDTMKEVKISFCANCEARGPFTVNSEQVG